MHARPCQRVEERGLAGVRVTDDRRGFQLGPPAAGSLLVALRTHLLDLALEVAHTLAYAPALDLDLLLAETSPGPHPTSPASDLAVVRVRADESRQEVVQPGRLDLQPALVSPGVLGEDLEDHFCAVEHANLELELQVALLPRAQVVVADDKIECALELELAELIQLAHADEVGGVDP